MDGDGVDGDGVDGDGVDGESLQGRRGERPGYRIWPLFLLETIVHTMRREKAATTALQYRETWYRSAQTQLVSRLARGDRRLATAAMSAAQWEHLASLAVCEAVRRRHRNALQPGNPFHPSVLERLQETASAVREPAAADLGVLDVLEQLPHLERHLSMDGTAQIIRAEVARLQRMAADPVMLTEFSRVPAVGETPAGQQLTVQHEASGLRGRFIVRDGMGQVYSKPQSIASIDPNERRRRRTAVWWRDVTGLGIGAQLYLHAAQLLPETRWDFDGQTRDARALRAKLHERDPWRWRAATCSCRDRWSELTPETAAQDGPHTRPAIPQADDQAL